MLVINDTDHGIGFWKWNNNGTEDNPCFGTLVTDWKLFLHDCKAQGAIRISPRVWFYSGKDVPWLGTYVWLEPDEEILLTHHVSEQDEFTIYLSQVEPLWAKDKR